MAGYTTMYHEVEQQIAPKGLAFTHVFLQAGVGGFAAASVAAVHLSKSVSWASDCKFVIVEPTDADCVLENILNPPLKNEPLRFALGATNSIMAGLNCGQPSILAWPVLRDLASGFIALGDSYAKEAVCELHAHGVVAGESGAAGLAGLMALTQQDFLVQEKTRLGLDEKSVVLIVNTEVRI